MIRSLGSLFLAGILLSVVAHASEKPAPAVNADTKEAFVAVADWVHKQMGSGGRYASLNESERHNVDAKLGEMGERLNKFGAVAQMPEDAKIKMFNDQEEVNAILGKRDNERLICKSEMPIGSHLPVKTCRTFGEIERDRLATQKSLTDRSRNNPQLQHGN